MYIKNITRKVYQKISVFNLCKNSQHSYTLEMVVSLVEY